MNFKNFDIEIKNFEYSRRFLEKFGINYSKKMAYDIMMKIIDRAEKKAYKLKNLINYMKNSKEKTNLESLLFNNYKTLIISLKEIKIFLTKRQNNVNINCEELTKFAELIEFNTLKFCKMIINLRENL